MVRVLDASYYEPIGVVLLADPAGTVVALERGSAMVAVGEPTGGRQLVYYQRRSDTPAGTYADRMHIAHGRAWTDHVGPGATKRPSTHKLLALPTDALLPVGRYNPREGEIELDSDPESRVRLIDWLRLAGEADPATALASELLTTGAAHESRRHLRAALAIPGPPHPALVRFARQHGHDDLIDGPQR